MKNYSKQAIFLYKNNINSFEELETLRINKSDQLESLLFTRKKLWNSTKRSKEEKMQELENQILDITKLKK